MTSSPPDCDEQVMFVLLPPSGVTLKVNVVKPLKVLVLLSLTNESSPCFDFNAASQSLNSLFLSAARAERDPVKVTVTATNSNRRPNCSIHVNFTLLLLLSINYDE